MFKLPIGFHIKNNDDEKHVEATEPVKAGGTTPRRSLVDVYFPQRGMTLTYYNDLFDLKKGDLVYVDGKLEGMQGYVVNVNYSFKIKLSAYKRVVRVADTRVSGEYFMADSYVITFSAENLSYEKVLSWFKAEDAEESEYVVGEGEDDEGFSLDKLDMKIRPEIADRGHDYYMREKVVYLSLEENRGRAIVEGREVYELEFEYSEGIVRNLVCSCYCNYNCKHEFAAMLRLRETLEFIDKNYAAEYNGSFAAMPKSTFLKFAVQKNDTGRFSF